MRYVLRLTGEQRRAFLQMHPSLDNQVGFVLPREARAYQVKPKTWMTTSVAPLYTLSSDRLPSEEAAVRQIEAELAELERLGTVFIWRSANSSEQKDYMLYEDIAQGTGAQAWCDLFVLEGSWSPEDLELNKL